MTHEIISGVPEPAAKRKLKRRKYPFESMAVGDMLFVPDKQRNTMPTYASIVGRKLGRKFSTRLIHMRETLEGWTLCGRDDPGAVQGIGLWRIE